MRCIIARSLGLDIGDKRIGVALSDPGGILASPFSIVDRREESQDIETIVDIINQHQVNQVVVGLPRSMNGSIGKQAEKVKAFVQSLSSRTKVSIEFRGRTLDHGISQTPDARR